MKKRLKINGILVAIAIFLIVLFPSIFLRNIEKSNFDEIMEIFGIAFILLGQMFRLSARGYKSEHSHNGHTLIKGGPYTLVRNPMYLGILLIGLGVVLVLFKWWVVFIFLLVFAIRYILLIFKEEKKLAVIFAQDYRDYCQRVPRILPSPDAIFKRDVAEYLPFRLSWLKREVGSILAVLSITLLLESWEEIKRHGAKGILAEIIEVMVVTLLFVGLLYYLNRRVVNPIIDVSNQNQSN
jgi:protein-S-isoprenylcysteine O-methyltransferase Ste14